MGTEILFAGPAIEIDGVKYHHHVNGGGLVAETAHVADTAFIGPFAKVCGKASISGEAFVFGNAWIFDNAEVCDNAQVFGNAKVFGNARVSGNAKIYGFASVYGNANVTDFAEVCDFADVSGSCMVCLKTRVEGRTKINEDGKAEKQESCDIKPQPAKEEGIPDSPLRSPFACFANRRKTPSHHVFSYAPGVHKLK